jgi:hypothetical protein
MKKGKKAISTTGGTDVSQSTKAGYSAAIAFFTDFAKEADFSSVLEFPEDQINEFPRLAINRFRARDKSMVTPG